jgi:ERCC4-type nuclease
MVIQVDSREKDRAIKKILSDFDSADVKWFVSKLPVADYMNLDNPKILVDRKQNLLELANNVCQDHKRFAAELTRAKEFGMHIVVLVEHGHGIKCLADVMDWENPRLKVSPMAVSGERLFRILSTMQCNSRDYSVEFQFCDKSETGSRIIELLGGGPNE